jgi:hypothetical protein
LVASPTVGSVASSLRLSLAARLHVTNHVAIDDAMYEDLRTHF